ncbi:hypothetical protein [Azoarcus taiwanensis]|uniref:Uncharacterized protein n=1 Tax=Azoarcus taiwanensis TaxID=666964 RepID=A0A972FGE6_9RHOO|nr:hypothetical protein [Azoarcus taiwanensis]NMG05088.1 hypothetical protein [Azoarcus taiwanensis]
MKYNRIVLLAILSFLSASLAYGNEESLTIHVHDASDIVSISQFNIPQAHTYIVAATLTRSDDMQAPESTLQFMDFRTGQTQVKLHIEQAPLLSPPGPQSGMLVLPQLQPDIRWNIFEPHPDLTGLELKGDLPSFTVVTQTLQTADGYYVSGMNGENLPVIAWLDTDFNMRQERVLSGFSPGMVTGILETGGKLIALVSSEKGSAQIRLSDNLDIESEAPIDGFGANGIALPDGGFVLTYVTFPEMNVLLERFDANHNSAWKADLYAMSRDAVSSGVKLATLLDGIAFAGFNENHLLVGRIGIDGKRMKQARALGEKLDFDPNPSSHFIFTHENTIHVWGLGMSTDSFVSTIYHAINN